MDRKKMSYNNNNNSITQINIVKSINTVYQYQRMTGVSSVVH